MGVSNSRFYHSRSIDLYLNLLYNMPVSIKRYENKNYTPSSDKASFVRFSCCKCIDSFAHLRVWRSTINISIDLHSTARCCANSMDSRPAETICYGSSYDYDRGEKLREKIHIPYIQRPPCASQRCTQRIYDLLSRR